MMLEEFIDKDLGRVVICTNNRSKQITARYKDGEILLTVPSAYSSSKAKLLFEEIKPQILKLEPRYRILFDENTQFETCSFKLVIRKHQLQNYYTTLKDKTLTISCPEIVDFESKETQKNIRNYIETALRSDAKKILPEKVKNLAQKYGFNYTAVKINSSKTRWGSCSSKQSINLSFFCMLLPLHLIDFVILHELCHTIEMNHGERFWKLLDKVANNNARQLTKELRNVKTGW